MSDGWPVVLLNERDTTVWQAMDGEERFNIVVQIKRDLSDKERERIKNILLYAYQEIRDVINANEDMDLWQ